MKLQQWLYSLNSSTHKFEEWGCQIYTKQISAYCTPFSNVKEHATCAKKTKNKKTKKTFENKQQNISTSQSVTVSYILTV